MRRPARFITRIQDLAQAIRATAQAQQQMRSELAEFRSQAGPALAGQAREIQALRESVVALQKELSHTYRQLEAMSNLTAMLPADGVLPATRGWAASPDLLLVLVDLLVTRRPLLTVECGSGASTLWLALAIRRFGIEGKIVALDHEPAFAAKTREFLGRHGVADVAEVRDAPLEDFELDGSSYRWYARAAWQGLGGIGLLFVDGPPSATGPQAGYPALPLLRDELSPDAVIVLAGLVLPGMQQVLQRWRSSYPEFSSEVLQLEKQAAVLRRG